MKLNDTYLLEKCEPFDFKDPPFDPIEFSKNLVKFVYDNNAIGVAANQVGVPYRIFALRGAPENFVCFNPKIIDKSEEDVILEEGCLSYPGLLVKIKRSKMLKVRFSTPNGDTITKKFTGITARAFQHEYEHLDGIRFYDNANKFHRDQGFRKWKR